MAKEKLEEIKFDSRILSSSHLNFFFGAGVNGKSVKQMKDFEAGEIPTLEALAMILDRGFTRQDYMVSQKCPFFG